jgi:hypothetical protein
MPFTTAAKATKLEEEAAGERPAEMEKRDRFHWRIIGHLIGAETLEGPQWVFREVGGPGARVDVRFRADERRGLGADLVRARERRSETLWFTLRRRAAFVQLSDLKWEVKKGVRRVRGRRSRRARSAQGAVASEDSKVTD